MKRTGKLTYLLQSFIPLDYDAPLTENGDYTEKYDKAVEMIAQYDTLAQLVVKPERPQHVAPVVYPDARVTEMMNLEDIINQVVRMTTQPYLIPLRLMTLWFLLLSVNVKVQKAILLSTI